jgi:4-hydroxyproline epimerase
MRTISFLDSHTAGEPTRLILAGGPDLGGGSVAAQLDVLRTRHDRFRRAVNTEPRGHDVLVSALLVQPDDPSADLAVIFFNNVGYLGMCGHGTIGLMASLAYLGRVQPGNFQIETPVGIVRATLHRSEHEGYPTRVSVRNIPSYRFAAGVAVHVAGRALRGDVAWGGNWFFLTHDHGLDLKTAGVETLTEAAWQIRAALAAQGITGAAGAEIDHIELLGPSKIADSAGFMLCPGRAYDRSPCGTGTSAKLACLAGDGKLNPGEIWRHEGAVGGVFEGRYEQVDGAIIPTITGEAWVMGQGELLVDPRDPFGEGI